MVFHTYPIQFNNGVFLCVIVDSWGQIYETAFFKLEFLQNRLMQFELLLKPYALLRKIIATYFYDDDDDDDETWK